MGWAPKQEYLEGPSKKRQLVFLKIHAVDEKKDYPEQDDGQVHLVLGDPHTSPVWTEAAKQMDIGEKAAFTMTFKTVDFDPEGLCPTDETKTWEIELLRVLTVEDVNEDFSQLLHIEEE